MKMPDEIKKALKCHRDGRACHDCPYEQGRTFSVDGVTFGCSKDIVADALDYIERLEAKMEERTMSETDKCPYCGDRMKIRVSLTTPDWGLLSAQYKCMTCGSTSPRIEFPGDTANDEIIERLQAVSSRRAEPKNRVLTMEELKAYCEGGADATPLWYDEKERNVSRWMVIDLPELSFGSTATVKSLLNSQFFEPAYGENWRCWLRKPTEAERRETPWES